MAFLHRSAFAWKFFFAFGVVASQGLWFSFFGLAIKSLKVDEASWPMLDICISLDLRTASLL